jgi:hypothetical protein
MKGKRRRIQIRRRFDFLFSNSLLTFTHHCSLFTVCCSFLARVFASTQAKYARSDKRSPH